MFAYTQSTKKLKYIFTSMIYLNIIKYNVTSIISIDNKIQFTEKNTLKFKYITNYTTYVILLYSCEAWLRINVTLLEAFSASHQSVGGTTV